MQGTSSIEMEVEVEDHSIPQFPLFKHHGSMWYLNNINKFIVAEMGMLWWMSENIRLDRIMIDSIRERELG